MREIKFRAWKHSNSRMYSVTNMMWKDDWVGVNSTDSIGINYTRSSKPNEYELMQYTGLKDKNGVEIYEGDIINVPYGKFVHEDNDKILDFIPCTIEQSKMGWWAKPTLGKKTLAKRQGKRQQMFFEHTDKTEVIGNIYENPELLQDSV